jgi:hypothetical protein
MLVLVPDDPGCMLGWSWPLLSPSQYQVRSDAELSFPLVATQHRKITNGPFVE